MAPTKTRVTKQATNKKRRNKNCCANTSSTSSASTSSNSSSSSSSSESSYTTSDCVDCSSDTESSDCDCSDSDCSDCWECECVPQRKRGGKHKKMPSPKVSKAVNRGRKSKKHMRRSKYDSSSDELSCRSSDDCYECEPKKPGRRARV